jgi:hypothetical protein
MNATTLKVGQIVGMRSGAYYYSGRVVEITPDAIYIDMRWESKLEIWKFNLNGISIDSRDAGHISESYEHDGAPCTIEGGNWILHRIEAGAPFSDAPLS